ncbi:YhbY family RNA-binding protein [Beduinella massiliensis]|uniref:YhbY family RNA-binding protein n=1 Tax=Beduinella massiliensis TaxID=1852363 RepID=UPI000C85CD60
MTSKQRAMLRSMANTMQPILHVGKEGVTPNIVQQAWEALEARELIKGTVLETSPQSAREVIAELCEKTHAEPVQCIGSKFVIYRPASKDPKIVLE